MGPWDRLGKCRNLLVVQIISVAVRPIPALDCSPFRTGAIHNRVFGSLQLGVLPEYTQDLTAQIVRNRNIWHHNSFQSVRCCHIRIGVIECSDRNDNVDNLIDVD